MNFGQTKIEETAKQRIHSLDALRGFDMFWIISGEGIFHGLADGIMKSQGLSRNPYTWQISINDQLNLIEKFIVCLSNQLHHSPWNGFTFYDLIFPLFIFISGVSMPFAYQNYFSEKAKGKGSSKIYYSLIKRTLTLIILGMIVNGLLNWNGYENTRIASVLGRIGLSTFFAALIYLNFTPFKQLAWFIALLLGYFLLMRYIPVPGYGQGIFTPEGNLSAYIDRLILPGKLHREVYDPEGLFSTIPAVCSAMLGIFTGTFIKANPYPQNTRNKLLILILTGISFLLIAIWLNPIFPINKSMWTSTFVIFAGGWSILLFALFYFLIDVLEYRKWSKPLIWIGINSILIYICAHGLFNFESTSRFLFGGLISKIPVFWQKGALWLGVLFIQLYLLKILYDRKWFLKI